MAFQTKTARRVRLPGDFRMTLEADPVHTLREQGLAACRMRLMTRHALAGCHGGMHVLVRELLLVVAGKAKFRRPGEKEFFCVCLVGAVAAHAHARSDRRVDDFLPDDPLLFMTIETQSRDLFHQEFSARRGVRLVAGAAESAGNRGVRSLLPHKALLVMTGKTEHGDLLQKKFLHFTAMGVVTRGALAGRNGRMDRLVFEFRFVMAIKT
jgi:hypothetical protein